MADRTTRWSGWSGGIAVAVASAFLAGGLFGIAFLDFACHMDGPGIGLEWSRPLGDEYGLRALLVLGLGVLQTVLSLTAYGRARAKPFGVLALPAFAFVGLVVSFGLGGRALVRWWWGWGCNRGHAYACYAAGGVTDGAAGKALDERACSGDVGSACHRIGREDPSRVPALCATHSELCRTPVSQHDVRGRCHALDELCGATDVAPGR